MEKHWGRSRLKYEEFHIGIEALGELRYGVRRKAQCQENGHDRPDDIFSFLSFGISTPQTSIVAVSGLSAQNLIQNFEPSVGSGMRHEKNGSISSTNFQLHPPRGKNTNNIRNTFGNLSYPLLFSSVRKKLDFELETYNKDVMTNGFCKRI